jgi:hypothetical protein
MIREDANEIKKRIAMQQFITPFLNEVSSLPPKLQVIAVLALGMMSVWLAMRHIDKNAGYY